MKMDFEAELSDYERFAFSSGPWTRLVYRGGSGPAVIVIHEIPGLHPMVIRFADRIVGAGMTVFLPVLFGQPGRPVTPLYAIRSMVGAICVHRESNVWSAGKSSPIVDWLRALAHKAHEECGGKGVGAVGMCFTGGFALAMMTEPAVVAPVLSQPSLPVAAGSRKRAAGIDASPKEVACARQRFADENLSMIGLRFKSDAAVPDARFETYRRDHRTGRSGRAPFATRPAFRSDPAHEGGWPHQGRRAAGNRFFQATDRGVATAILLTGPSPHTGVR
jgi:dienelactone hydrolase